MEGSSWSLLKGSGTLGHIFMIFCGPVRSFSRKHIFCILYLLGLWPFRSSFHVPQLFHGYLHEVKDMFYNTMFHLRSATSARVILAQVCTTSYTKMYNNIDRI